MKIKINLNIFLFFILFILTNQIKIYLLIMGFALLHELAHLVCGIILGFRVDVLRIIPLGFSVKFKVKTEDYNKKIIKSNMLSIKKIIIALAGPIINLIIVILGILLKMNTNIIYSNLLIFLFNLIPINPLDGGKILKNIFKIFCGNKKANKYTNIVSNLFFVLFTIICSILILIYKNLAIFLIIIFLGGIVIKENKRYNTYNKIYKVIDKKYNYL